MSKHDFMAALKMNDKDTSAGEYSSQSGILGMLQREIGCKVLGSLAGWFCIFRFTLGEKKTMARPYDLSWRVEI